MRKQQNVVMCSLSGGARMVCDHSRQMALGSCASQVALRSAGVPRNAPSAADPLWETSAQQPTAQSEPEDGRAREHLCSALALPRAFPVAPPATLQLEDAFPSAKFRPGGVGGFSRVPRLDPPQMSSLAMVHPKASLSCARS